MQNYLGDGDQLIIIAPKAVASGQALLIGSIFGVCLASAAQGQPVEFWLKGIYQLPKNPGEAWSLGDALYWNDVDAVVTQTPDGNICIGVATAPTLVPSSVGNVRLNAALAIVPSTGAPTLDLTKRANVELFPAI